MPISRKEMRHARSQQAGRERIANVEKEIESGVSFLAVVADVADKKKVLNHREKHVRIRGAGRTESPAVCRCRPDSY